MNRAMIFRLAEMVDNECGQENGPGSEWLTAFAEMLITEMESGEPKEV